MTLFMGIDGGGSTLRVAVTDAELNLLAQVESGTANPSVIGRGKAAQHIQEVIRRTLEEANATANDITAVGIGVAGAAAAHAETWLRESVTPVLPDALIVPSSDYEIALVGARGERFGVLLLAGTGTVAFGINSEGQTALAGGWGYKTGDEGGGFWIGFQALRLMARVSDQVEVIETELPQGIMDALKLSSPRDLIDWLYADQSPRVPEIAALTEVVFEYAERRDPAAEWIVRSAAVEIEMLPRALARQLRQPDLPLAVAGGLLTSDNPLSRRVAALLGYERLPQPLHPPVIGAALLAKLTWEG